MVVDILVNPLVEPLTYPFMQRGLLAAIIVGVVCAIIGSYVVLRGLAFMGDTKGGRFELAPADAARMLATAGNHAVVRPWVNGRDITGSSRGMHIIDFDGHTRTTAARHTAPFAHITAAVRPLRARSRSTAAAWWLHERPRTEMRAAIADLPRYLVTPTASRHRLFTWLTPPTLPDHQLIVIARADAYTFGVLHARPHELWSLRMCSRLGVGNDPRYTPTTTFETFPFPAGMTPADTAAGAPEGPAAEAIATAARRLDELRSNWLNPADWVDWVITPEEEAAGFPKRPVARPGHEAELKKRTLTNLYNQRPAWLANAHAALDAAVASAYGWADYSPAMADDEILRRLLQLNQARA